MKRKVKLISEGKYLPEYRTKPVAAQLSLIFAGPKVCVSIFLGYFKL